MEGRGQMDVVYTDFEKAFEHMDHDILLRKLYSLGTRSDLLRWIQLYVTNRCQAVVLGRCKSDYTSIPSGVPQESYLGLLLYNAYIYDIDECFSQADHLF